MGARDRSRDCDCDEPDVDQRAPGLPDDPGRGRRGPAGATIHVAPGSYSEQVDISKDLDLRGAGAGLTTIKSPPTLTPFAVNTLLNSPITAIVRVGHGAHVRVSRLTISGPIPCDSVTGVAVVQAATLDLFDAHVRDITHDASCPEVQTARAVMYGLPPYSASRACPVARPRSGGSTTWSSTTTRTSRCRPSGRALLRAP